jgi:hypothetical protein
MDDSSAPAGSAWDAFEDAIRRFEDAWRSQARPEIGAYVPAGGPGHARLLTELVHVDLEYRLRAGEAARVEDYLALYPALADDPETVLGLLTAEYELRRRGDPRLGATDYLRRFPHYSRDLPDRIATATVAGGALDTPRPEQPPPTVPGYEVLDPLGRGGMGVVYAARQLSLNRPVALKFLPEACARDPVWLDRFRREALTASALNHPNICTIYDTGESAGRPFLSMELVEGRTLAELIDRRPAADELARLIGQAARALAAAHAAGVVHRDIKPQNLMARADGIVKVLDFGLARRLPAAGAANAARDTDPGTRVGTVLYMSPEQARGEPVGTASDIFSLGVVVYELATGQHPFPALTEAGVVHSIADQTPPPMRRLNPEVPAALDALVQHMMAKDPRLRPTAAEADAALADLTGTGTARPGRRSPGRGRRVTVGREAELSALRGAFESAAAGCGLLVCVTGEPGLGKTTLVEDFLAELAAGDRPPSLARGRCSERLAGAEAYLPFLEALDSLLQGDGGAAAAQVMKVVAPTWYVQLAPLAADDPTLARVLEEAKGAPQERRKRELGVFLHELSRRRPLVVFLDDIHWADPSSVDLLAYLGGKCAGLCLLVVLTYRLSDLALGRHPFGPVKLDLQGRGACREVALLGLTRADLDRYLALTFAGHRFPEEFAAAVHAKTGGTPLFMVDLLRYLHGRGVIVRDGDRWGLAQAVPDLERELPESVLGMIQRKVDQLDEADRQLLMAASVQGPEFDSAVAARVLGADAAAVEERLDTLDRVHALVRLVGEWEFPDGTLTQRYRFVHVLYQNALYAALRPTRKAAWSAAAAQALLDHYGEDSAAAATELALLFAAARDADRATDFFLRAARNSVHVFAHQEAAALARRGLDLLPRLPDTPARAARERALLLTLGVSLVATEGFAAPEVEQAYARARELCRRPEDAAALFPVLYGLWNVALLRCDLTRCADLATQMSALARGQSDLVLHLQAHNVLQQPLLHRGDFAAARQHQEQALALYDPHLHRHLAGVYGEDPGVGCRVYGAVTRWGLGYPDQALRSAQAARALADELSNPFDVARALYFGALTRLCRREPGPTQELAAALTELTREYGYAMLAAGAMILHGWCLAEQEQPAEGIDWMRRGLADWRATGAVSHRPYQLALLARALARSGRAETKV